MRLGEVARAAAGRIEPVENALNRVSACSGSGVGVRSGRGGSTQALSSTKTGSTREVVMLIMAVHQVPSLTQEKYEEVVRRLTNGKARIESRSDLPFEGLLVHMAGQTKKGFCVVDLFESEDAVARFNEAMGTIPREVGIEEPPDFFPAHTFMSA
jgi:hypothetical protein